MSITNSKFIITITIFSIASVGLSTISIFNLNQELVKAKVLYLNDKVENYSLIVCLILSLILIVLSACMKQKVIKVIGLVLIFVWMGLDVFVIYASIAWKNRLVNSYEFVFGGNYKAKASEIQNANKCCGWDKANDDTSTECSYENTCHQTLQNVVRKAMIIIIVMFGVSLALNTYNAVGMIILFKETCNKSNDYVQIAQAPNSELSYL